MAVGADVVGDVAAGVVDRFPFGSPGAALLELAEPGLDERLRFGISVATARMRHASGGEVFAEAARGELGAVVSAQREDLGRHPAFDHRGVDTRDRFVGAAAKLEVQPTSSRVQQSTAWG